MISRFCGIEWNVWKMSPLELSALYSLEPMLCCYKPNSKNLSEYKKEVDIIYFFKIPHWLHSLVAIHLRQSHQ